MWTAALTGDEGYLAGDFELADWRPELHTALLSVTRDGRVHDTAMSYDVTTGVTREVTLPRRAISVGLDPDGRTRLPGTGGSRALGPFHRIDDAGRVDVISDADVVRAAGSRWHLAWARRGGVLTQQGGPGRVTRVPGTTGLRHLARARGADLLLARSGNLLESPRTRGVLEVYDTATGTRDVLLRLDRGQAWRSVIGATEVRPWNP